MSEIWQVQEVEDSHRPIVAPALHIAADLVIERKLTEITRERPRYRPSTSASMQMTVSHRLRKPHQNQPETIS
jgi:hypothetical protein